MSNPYFRGSVLSILLTSLLWGQGTIVQSNESPSLNDAPGQSEEGNSCLDRPSAYPSDPERTSDSASTLESTSIPTFIPALSPQYPPPELHWIDPGAILPEGLTTHTTFSLLGLTPPSLWWADHQFGGKTLKGWIAYPGTETLPPRVDLVVNRQLWGLSDYLERYSFVHHFGRSAQCFGYTIRVFNDVGDSLAIYPCPLEPCSVILNSSGLGILRDNDPFSTF